MDLKALALGGSVMFLSMPSLLAPAFAHHSHAMFDERTTTQVTGVVKEIEWVNPHSWLHLVAMDETGKVPVTWSFEMGALVRMAREGWTKDTVKVGDKVELSFHPLKDGSRGGQFRKLVSLSGGRSVCRGDDCGVDGRTATLRDAEITAALARRAPAETPWNEYIYDDLGFGAYFPNAPEREIGEYVSRWGTAPATIIVLEEDNIVYRVTVAELQDKMEISATMTGECTALAEEAGKQVANVTTRIGTRETAVFGRLSTVDLNDDKGRAVTTCLFNKGRLYKIEAIVLPARNPEAPEAIRFANALSFNMDLEYGPNAGGPRE